MALTYNIQQFNPAQPVGFGGAEAFINARNKQSQQQMLQTQIAQAQAQAQAQAEAEARDRAILDEAFNAAHQNPTAENRLRLINLHADRNPAKAKEFRESFAAYDESRQRTILRDATSVLSALDTSKEFGLSLLKEEAEAAKNANNSEGAKMYMDLIAKIESSPEGFQAAKDALVLTIGAMPGGDKAIEALSKIGQERRAEQMQPLNMEKTLADIGYTKAQTNKILAELEKMKATGTADPEQLFAKELQLNKEYTSRTQSYDESLRLNDVINSSAKSVSSAGDVALISAFMKMLDPRSVVRESEFSIAQDTGGLLAKLEASLAKAQSGQLLIPRQRDEFVSLAGQYMQAAASHEQRVRDGLNNLVKNYGLNPDNVFGTMSQTGTGTATATGTAGTTGATPIPAAVPAAPPVVATTGATNATASRFQQLKDFVKKNNPGLASVIDAYTDEAALRARFQNGARAFDAQFPVQQVAPVEKEPVIRGGF
jgi:hypothetical protein